jgi:hypothetical protein
LVSGVDVMRDGYIGQFAQPCEYGPGDKHSRVFILGVKNDKIPYPHSIIIYPYRNLGMMKTFVCSILVLSGILFAISAHGQTVGTLSFTYTPVAHSGTWGEKHVLAVWIQDNSDNFIRTKFRYWGNGTDDHLPNWVANSNENVTDATTGPTLTSYSTRSFTWDGSDLSGALLPDGDYKITIEECWSHGSNNVTKSFTFTKNGAESHLTPDDDADFTDVALDWVPSTTGLESIEHTASISVFPNPAKDKIYIDFSSDAKAYHIYIVNTLGQEVYSEKAYMQHSGVKTIDVSAFENGIYFVHVEVNSTIYTIPVVLQK